MAQRLHAIGNKVNTWLQLTRWNGCEHAWCVGHTGLVLWCVTLNFWFIFYRWLNFFKFKICEKSNDTFARNLVKQPTPVGLHSGHQTLGSTQGSGKLYEGENAPYGSYNQKLAMRTLRRLLTPGANMNAPIRDAFNCSSRKDSLFQGSPELCSPSVKIRALESRLVGLKFSSWYACADFARFLKNIFALKRNGSEFTLYFQENRENGKKRFSPYSVYLFSFQKLRAGFQYEYHWPRKNCVQPPMLVQMWQNSKMTIFQVEIYFSKSSLFYSWQVSLYTCQNNLFLVNATC